MIEIGSLISRSAGALPKPRQPEAGVAVSQEPVRQNPQADKPPLRVVQKPTAAEDLALYNQRSRYTGLQDQGAIDVNSRRALSAYGAVSLHAEREYLQELMGVDEYV